MEPDSSLAPAKELATRATRRQTCRTELTSATTGGEGADHKGALLKPLDIASDLDDFTDEFVAHGRPRVESGLAAVVDMEIGAADPGQSDRDDRITGRLDTRVWQGFTPDLFKALKGEGKHGSGVSLWCGSGVCQR